MVTTHYNIRSQLLIEANKLPNVKLWPNPVGLAWNGRTVRQFTEKGKRYIVLENPRPVKYGLAPGSCDTIGFKTVAGTPCFMALEVKAGSDSLKPKQKNYIDMVKKFGGIAGVVRKIEDFFGLIR